MGMHTKTKRKIKAKRKVEEKHNSCEQIKLWFCDKENFLVFSAALGALLMSLGVWFIGTEMPVGSLVLGLGSAILSISVVIFVFFFA